MKEDRDMAGKLVSQINIKSDGNLFHEQFRYKTTKIPEMCPEMVRVVYLERGQMGAVGSVLGWHFTTNDGKKMFSKEEIEAIDEKKKSITFTSIEGDLKEAYKTFKFIVDVSTTKKGDHDDQDQDTQLVTWTLVYEKQTEAVPDPHAIMDLCINVTKQIERHHLLVPN